MFISELGGICNSSALSKPGHGNHPVQSTAQVLAEKQQQQSIEAVAI